MTPLGDVTPLGDENSNTNRSMSSLQANLQSVCKDLHEKMMPSNEPIHEALAFLESQHVRVEKAERALLDALEGILPNNHSSDGYAETGEETVLSTSEVTQFLEKLKSTYDHQQSRLLNILCKNSIGKENIEIVENLASKPLDPFHEAECPNSKKGTPIYEATKNSLTRTPFSIVRLLPDLTEIDNETDGGTPGSVTSRLSPRKKVDIDKVETTKTNPRTPRYSTICQISPKTLGNPSTGRKRQDAFLQLEFKLQRDVHKIQPVADTQQGLKSPLELYYDDNLITPSNILNHESDPQQTELTSSHDEPSLDLGDRMTVDGGDIKYKREKSDEESDIKDDQSTTLKARTAMDCSMEDDSALYCATVLAKDGIKSGVSQSHGEDRPSFVEFVEDSIPTSAQDQTLLTMDDDEETDGQDIDDDKSAVAHQLEVIEETGSVQSIVSNETSVLDRYRLDVDDTSPHGVRVVPNERRKRHLSSRTKKKSNAFLHRGLVVTEQTYSALLPRDVTSTPSKATSFHPKFRKTPHPKWRVAPTIDENAPLDEAGANTASRYQSHKSIQVPLTTPNSSRSPHNSIYSSSIFSSGGSSHISLLTSPAARPRALRPADRASEDEPIASSDLLYARDASAISKSSSPYESTANIHVAKPDEREESEICLPTQIKNVSLSEYEAAPPIVKNQVTLNEVQSAVRLINQALCFSSSMGCSDIEMTEADLQHVLGLSERQCKSIAMSLCHWRRLLMRRSASNHKGREERVFGVIAC